MSKARLEVKVGLFILIGLVLLGFLLLQFSKGASLFRPTYTINLVTENAGGLRRDASVLMAGVAVGTVSEIQLAPDGKTVTIVLKIYKEFIVRKDAQFLIEQSGFLGDNYVAINPLENAGEPFKNEEHARAQEPFNLQKVARSAAGFIQRVDEAATNLNSAISDVRRLVLNPQTLTNLSTTVGTMRVASERAMATIDEINVLFVTNGPMISTSASNLAVVSESLKQFAAKLNGLLETNSDSIARSVKNVESSTVVLKNIFDDTQSGKGLAGTLLHNEQVAINFADMMNNLAITSSNLNRRGLWGILWSKKPAKPTASSQKITTPKTSPNP
jgi:phospholipid/cholesterol/gamma-HCH transport system substrate-binding protein